MADETSKVYAAGRAGQPISDWRDSVEAATQDVTALNGYMEQAKATPDVILLQGTRTVVFDEITEYQPAESSVAPDDSAEPVEQNTEAPAAAADEPADTSDTADETSGQSRF